MHLFYNSMITVTVVTKGGQKLTQSNYNSNNNNNNETNKIKIADSQKETKFQSKVS